MEQPLDAGQLNNLKMQLEFRLWDSERNKVPQIKLEEIRLKIRELRAKISEAHAHVFIPLS